jgi:hypothetical protein
MTPELWERLKPLFHAVLEKPEGARALFIEDVTSRDRELGDALRVLVSTNGKSADQAPFDLQDLFPAPKPVFASGEPLLSRFRIIRLIGSGGMGEVYEATDLQLGRVALKTIRPEIAGDPHTSYTSGKRFSSLAKSAARRLLHSRAVCAAGFLQCLPRAFISMEFLDGVTLEYKIREAAPPPWQEAKRIALEICDGLRIIHDAGITSLLMQSRSYSQWDGGRNSAKRCMTFTSRSSAERGSSS